MSRLLLMIFLISFLGMMGFVFWPSQADSIDFNTQIRPILNNNCLSCHGGVKKNGGLSMLFREEALLPTKSGKHAIVPFHPEQSELLHRIAHHDPEERMPPESDPLTQEQIHLLTKWIEQGAKWETHWAYQALNPQISLPEVSSSWIRTDLDRFVLESLQEEGLSPSEEADPLTLLRRVSLDLTGLPPSQKEVESFVAHPSPEAYEQAVDRLLASPHFGERWASMWMDLARYGDSQGYQKDPARNIWRWRDWVIHAFNEDMPFDQFTIEQIAGDLLEAPSDLQLLATAFHRNTMNNDEGGTDNEEFRVSAVIDRVNTTFEIWQGTTIGCVQCHSHPYDPFRHKEFYQLYAFFNNTADADRPDEFPTEFLMSPAQEAEVGEIISWIADHDSIPIDDLPGSLFADESVVWSHSPFNFAVSCDPCGGANGRLGDGFEYLRRISSGTQIRYSNLDLTAVDSLFVQYLGGNGSGRVDIRLDNPTAQVLRSLQLPPTNAWYGQSVLDWKEAGTAIPVQDGIHDLYLTFSNETNKGSVADFLGFYLQSSSAADAHQVRKKFLQLATVDAGKTPIMRELSPENSRTSRVFERGNWLVHGDTVYPNVPQVLNSFPTDFPANRLGLAKWLVHPENPLTARVIVNRFWEQMFGIGLVETLEDFGTQGEKPSHPDMLDWLASNFIHQQQWHVKHLLKEIVMSATYRQSSAVTADLLERDPANRWLARGPRIRLSAEQLRDQALASSGLLDTKVYGPSVMPSQPDGIWQVIRNVMKWTPSEGSSRYRRTLYTYWRRSSPYPTMMTFDAPSREFCVSRRVRTNTPLQALTTLNDSTFIEAAEALANRMQVEGGSTPSDQLKYGYYLTMNKAPSPEKAAILDQFYLQTIAHYSQQPEELEALLGSSSSASPEYASLINVANVILNLDEVITKE
ncbi:MAG: DUF1553 domain-containing protein [Bacteroidota bacterium]